MLCVGYSLLRPGHYDLLYHRYQSTDISGSHNQGLDIIEQMRERIRSESHPQPITDCTTNPQLKTTAPGTVSSKDKLAIDAVDDHHNMYNGYTDIYLDQKVDRLIVATFHSHEMKLVDFAGQSLWKLHVDEEHDVETYADLPFTTQAIIERSEQSLDEESLCQEAMRAVNHSMYVTGRWIFLRSNSSSSSSFSNSSMCSHTIADQILFIPRYLLFFIVEVYIEDRETAAGVGHSLATAPSSNHLLSNTFVIALNMKEALHVKDMETAIWYNIGLSETDVQFDHDQALESLLMQHLSHAEQPIESDPMLSFYLPRLKVIPKQRRTSIVLQYIDVSLPVEVVLPMNQQALEILVRDVFDLSDLVYVEIYREGGLLTSNVNMDFDLGKEESAVVLEVKFCGHCVINHHIPSVDEEGKQRELITLTNCQHILCLHCLESLIDTSFPQGQYMYALPSMENLPWDADRSLLIPEFRGMQCPTCTKDIFSIDVEVCDRNGRDWQAVLATIPPKKVHKQCCMPAYCMDEDFYPVDDLIQLSCSHFFHEPCIVGSVRNQIESAKRNIQTIICPKCKDLDVFCTCPNCSWKPEGYHVITVDEIKSWLGPDDDGEALQQKEFDAWERIGVLLATDDATKTLSCRCGCIFCVDKQATSVQCPTDCGYCICVQVTDFFIFLS